MKTAMALLVTLVFLAAPSIRADSAAVSAKTAAPVDSLAPDSPAPAQTVGTDTAEAALYPMSPERHAKLVAYSKFTNIWRFVNFLVGLAILALLLFTGLSARFRDWASHIKPKFLAMWAFVALFMLTDYLLNLPFAIYRGFFVEDSYGFLNQTFLEWWGEDLLGLLIGTVFMIIPVWFFYRLVNRTRRWWLWFSLGAIPFVVLIVVIVPVVISPMFNDFGPLEDKQLEAEILTLADRAGIEGADVFQVDASKQSSKINAYVTGLFGTKRIVLYDTLIKNFALDEIKFVMAHEMGHYVKHHIWQGLALAILFMMFAFWLTGRLIPAVIAKFKQRFGFDHLGDHASWPLVVLFLSVIMFVFQPVTNSFSRWMERQSDTYGMQMSGVDGESAAIAFDKLAVYNLSDPDPHPVIEFWFYSHPALNKRMAFVRGWKE